MEINGDKIDLNSKKIAVDQVTAKVNSGYLQFNNIEFTNFANLNTFELIHGDIAI